MSPDTSQQLAPPAPPFLSGVVIRSTGSWYDVQADDRVVPSKVRGKFRLEGQEVTNPVAVGDQVGEGDTLLGKAGATSTELLVEIEYPPDDALVGDAAGAFLAGPYRLYTRNDLNQHCISAFLKAGRYGLGDTAN